MLPPQMPPLSVGLDIARLYGTETALLYYAQRCRRAARAIARSWRHYESHYYTKLDQLLAATAIAAGWRGHVARWNIGCEQQASAAIARGWRRKQAQADAAASLAMLSAARRCTRAAIVLSSRWRGHAARLRRGPVTEPEVDQASPPPEPCEQPNPASPRVQSKCAAGTHVAFSGFVALHLRTAPALFRVARRRACASPLGLCAADAVALRPEGLRPLAVSHGFAS